MYILNIAKAIKKMSVNEIREFIFENYYKRIFENHYKRIGFSKESGYYSMKRLRKKKIYCCVLTN